MIVADTNLLAYLLLPTPHTPLAEAVFEHDSDWLAPVLIHSELRNILLGAVRHRQLATGQVASLLDLAREVVRTSEPLVDGPAVVALAVKSGCPAYDCEFVWLARKLGVKLVSSDKKVLAAFPRVAVSPQAFLQSGRRPGNAPK